MGKGGGGGGMGDAGGIARILSVVFGLIALCLVVCPPCGWRGGHDLGGAIFYGIVICFSISLILLVLKLFGVEHEILEWIDKIYHVCACILLIVVAICWWVHLNGATGGCTDNHISASVFMFAMGVCCGFIAYQSFSG